MKIYTTLDDSAARIPLSIRSSEGVWDRSADLRSAPGIQLVELATQHWLNTSVTLAEELAYYFEHNEASEDDPYALTRCYDHRTQLEDLLSDLYNRPRDQLVALSEIEPLFPESFTAEFPFTVALSVVGAPAFGYVRTYHDSEGDESHGLVVNIAQAQPHLEATFGQFSLDLLVDTIRDGFFNHEAFRVVYHEYLRQTGRAPARPVDRLKSTLLSRGIAWYLSYCRDLEFYDQLLDLDCGPLDDHIATWNRLVEAARRKNQTEPLLDDWLELPETRVSGEISLDVLGYFAARAIAEAHGQAGLREAIGEGPDRFIALFNETSPQPLLR